MLHRRSRLPGGLTMSVAFIDRPATDRELERLRLVSSTFRDGSGMLMAGGNSLPGWRDYERALAAVLGGTAVESKAVFDVLVPSASGSREILGLSVKSKQLSRRGALADLGAAGRVYMELANSPAKLWTAVQAAGASKADFLAQQNADMVGTALLNTVKSWRLQQQSQQAALGKTLLIDRSVYLVLSYSAPARGTLRHGERDYQWHSFDMNYPDGLEWKYKGRRLTADDPAHPGECLFDWYAESGGQLKYYPRAQYARFSSPPFYLEEPPVVSLLRKAEAYWPTLWAAATDP